MRGMWKRSDGSLLRSPQLRVEYRSGLKLGALAKLRLYRIDVSSCSNELAGYRMRNDLELPIASTADIGPFCLNYLVAFV